MPKTTKRVVISDSSLNKFGFRLLTGGADLTQYKKNPILLFMHSRAFGGKDNEVLPLGYVDDIEIEGDEITGALVFDDTDPFAMKIFAKWEHGTYRMVSASADPIETSDDPKLLLPGQRYATVTKWALEEVSVVDIGANNNSLVFYRNGKRIELASGDIPDFIPQIKTQNDMKLTDLATKLKLADNATEENVVSAIDAMIASHGALKQLNEDLKIKLSDVEADRKKEKIATLVDNAVKDGRIQEGQRDNFIKLANADLDVTEKLLLSLPKYKSIKEELKENEKKVDSKLLTMSWDELDKSGKLATVKASHPEHYRQLFKEKFGKEPVA